MKLTKRLRVVATSAILGTAFMAGASLAQKSSTRTVPSNTILRADLDDQLSSRTARKGDVFMATLSNKDYSGLPEGTRFQGVVTEVQIAGKDKPGMLDVRFQKAILPGGATVSFAGELADLDKKNLRRTSTGRLESKAPGKRFETKWVGYGAAGGAVLSTVLGGGTFRGALLGALGGAAYAYINKNKKKHYDEVEIAQKTEFGIRATQRLTFTDNSRYRYATYDPSSDRDRDRDR